MLFRSEVDLLQGDVLQVAAQQVALGQEGLVLGLRRLVLGARRHHDERLHGTTVGDPSKVRDTYLTNSTIVRMKSQTTVKAVPRMSPSQAIPSPES